jgi:thiol-disulfide isomerase/thioredoxin
MGEVNPKKVAVIINGDGEERHIENVETALKVLKSKGYETYVASPEKPTTPADHYTRATAEETLDMLDEVGEVSRGADLVVYTTGHGEKIVGDAGAIVLQDDGYNLDVLPLLDNLPYEQRTVIADQCYSGSWYKAFSDDPKSLFMSAGDSNQVVCCAEFAPYIWADEGEVPDLNGDGTINWLERYSHAKTESKFDYASPQFAITKGYVQEGEPAFGAEVVDVGGRDGLIESLAKLKPGQYAFVMFSTDYCKGCKAYRPRFEEFAKEAGGQHLFLYVNDEEAGEEFDVSTYPSVMIFNHEWTEGGGLKVGNLETVLDEIAGFYGEPPPSLALVRGELLDLNAHKEWFDKYVAPRVEEGREIEDVKLELLDHEDAEVRSFAIFGYAMSIRELGPDEMNEGVKKLWPFFSDPDPKVRIAALFSYGFVLFTKLDEEGCRQSIDAIMDAFEDMDSQTRIAAVDTLSYFLPKIPKEEAIGVIEELVKMMCDDKDAYLQMEVHMLYHRYTGKDRIRILQLEEYVPDSISFEALPRYRFLGDNSWDVRTAVAVPWLLEDFIGFQPKVGYAGSTEGHLLDLSVDLLLKHKVFMVGAGAGYNFDLTGGGDANVTLDQGFTFQYGIDLVFPVSESVGLGGTISGQHEMLHPQDFVLGAGIKLVYDISVPAWKTMRIE